MADTKITALAAITTVDPAADVLPIVDVSDTSMAASGTTKKITSNQILGAGGTATLASATITGDLTVATDRLKVVTGSTAIQTGATTQLQVGTTSWPSTVIGKSGSRSLFGNAGEVIIWNEAAPAIGNYSTLFVSAKTGAGATTMGGLQIRAGIENASNSDGFVSLWTSNSAAGGFVERYKIDSTGVSTWSVGGSTAMTLNSTGLGIGTASVTSGFKLDVVNGDFRVSDAAGADGVEIGWSAGSSQGFVQAYNRNTSAFKPLLLNSSLLVDTSGNVGVGVTPSAWTSSYKALQIGTVGAISSGSSSAYGFTLSSNLYQGASGNQYITTGYAGRYDIRTDNGNHVWYTSASGSGGGVILLSTAMTLDASGNLLVGKTASSTTVAGSQVQPDGTFSAVKGDANPGFFYNRSTAASGTIALFRSNSVTVGSITQDGTNTSYVTSSDYRLKDSIQPLSGGLARVNSLKPSIYTWKTNGSSGEGFLAHELAEVVPSAVVGTKDAVDADGNPIYQGVDLSKVVPILVAAIKELTARVEALEA